MNEYGVIQIGKYLLSVPGAFLYATAIFLMVRLAWELSGDDAGTPFRFTKFVAYALAFGSTATLLFIQLGVWFYVEA